MRAFRLILCLLIAPVLFGQPSAVGEWGAVFKWPVVAIHSHLLPDGRVLSWERKDTVLTTETWLWNPKKPDDFKKVMNPYASVFCSGHTFLPDGTLLVAGGHHFHDGEGEKTVTFFDYRTDSWSKGPDMREGRWYPTVLALRNGDVLVVSGEVIGGQQAHRNTLPQVWETATKTWRYLTGAVSLDPLYPMLLLAPDGRSYTAGPDAATEFIDTAGTGSRVDGPNTKNGFRDYGSAVMYEPGKILLVGGAEPEPLATAQTIDLNAAKPEWTNIDPMAFKRRQLNATILPDGKVLVTGGTSGRGFNSTAGSVLAAELWDPATGKWKTMASMAVRRIYHSTAVLLPDGRVLSAGGGMPPGEPAGSDTDHRDAQLYSPPYLFAGARPVITTAPEKVTYGERFYVKTPQAYDVRKVTWIRLTSVTHAFNQSQRFNRLDFNATAGDSLTVTAPSNATCPPGPYLIFLLNERGVPSEGKVVFIR